MGFYRKKPIIVKAEQWFPDKEIAGVVVMDYAGVKVPEIETIEGTMCVRPGDWIVTGIHGEKYPVRDDIFRATYEPVDSPRGSMSQ